MYLSSSNLLTSFEDIETSELDKISTIEKAVHNKNYPEKDLYELYKRFQFNISQLLNAKIIYKSLPSIEARALIYQKILLESQIIEKLELLKILKNSFVNENKENAFDVELKKFLKDIDIDDIPSNLTSFYLENMVKDYRNDLYTNSYRKAVLNKNLDTIQKIYGFMYFHHFLFYFTLKVFYLSLI